MREPLDDRVAAEVLDRLGTGRVGADEDGLVALYRAWCQNVPFDNLRKLVALADDTRPFPANDANDFFRAWLDHGTGATCWGSSNALFQLLVHLGFDVARLTAAMLERPDPNHGTNLVRIDGRHLLVDSSVLSGDPLVLGDTASHAGAGLYPCELRPDGDTWVMTFPSTVHGDRMICRVFAGVATAAAYDRLHEQTRAFSVFNDHPHVTRHLDGGVWNLRNDVLMGWTTDGTVEATLTDAERRDWLARAGFSDEAVDRALASVS